jgi:hypothetical protein
MLEKTEGAIGFQARIDYMCNMADILYEAGIAYYSQALGLTSLFEGLLVFCCFFLWGPSWSSV